MALYPKAIQKPIKPGPTDPRITPRVLIFHVAVSEAPSLHDYFNGPSGGVESHFYVRRDGTVEQYRDTAWQADANTDANGFALSVETQGMEAGEWTPQQVAALKALTLWCHQTHGIPLTKCATWDGSGVGYHTLFPGRWDKRGASCPGPDRIRQFNNVIVPWLAAPQPAEDDMTPEQARTLDYHTDQLKDVARRVNAVSAAIKALGAGLGPTVQAAVEAALAADYDATVTLTPKEN